MIRIHIISLFPSTIILIIFQDTTSGVTGLVVHIFTENCRVESFHVSYKASITFQSSTRNLYKHVHLPMIFQQNQLLVKRNSFKQLVVFPILILILSLTLSIVPLDYFHSFRGNPLVGTNEQIILTELLQRIFLFISHILQFI